ncbi:hypothetical protein FS764_17405 [Agrobacterium vitis]|uniref:hypothetical protein n=1 Tax=Agrobacterium vitis TaxID=373 RepID=UPI001F42111F|nr:hypothetical protein [Agrobacterium vitis]MCF1468684.1 hypothetical protein [Agrobacterium vitis]
MTIPPVVYLDTQDYSRFGDVLRGKSANGEDEALFLELERRKRNGDVVFPVSMPILAELLQYHPEYRETTLRKAEAVERLCGSWALAYPSRLIAFELASAVLKDETTAPILSDDRYWYPNSSDSLEEFAKQFQGGVSKKIAELPSPQNRKERRARKKQLSKFDPSLAVRLAVPEIAEKFGIPAGAVQASVVAFLEGRLTSAQASRKLFEAICEPSTFVQVYFERIESQRTLPLWLGDMGRKLKSDLDILQSEVQPYVHDAAMRQEMWQLLRSRSLDLGHDIAQLGRDGIDEFGATTAEAENLLSNYEALTEVPSYNVISKIVIGYVSHVLGLQGDVAKVERSFGGDLIHSLYLPHVNLWRGDRRFSDVVRRALPQYSKKIVAAPSDLLTAIERLLAP